MKYEIKTIAHLSEEYWESTILRNLILRTPLGLKLYKAELLNEKDQVHFVCVFQNSIVGCLILSPSKNNCVKMRQVCVATTFQGKQIGRKMVYFSEKWAVKNGFSSIFCHARNNAKNFYSSLGYIQKGKPFLEIGLEHYYFKKIF